MIINGLLMIVDLIWILSIGGMWSETVKFNDMWNYLHGLHIFGIVMSIIILLVKVNNIYIYLLCKYIIFSLNIDELNILVDNY